MATTEATEAEYRAQFEEIRQGTDRWPPLHDLMGIEMVRVTPTTILSMVLSDQVRSKFRERSTEVSWRRSLTLHPLLPCGTPTT